MQDHGSKTQSQNGRGMLGCNLFSHMSQVYPGIRKELKEEEARGMIERRWQQRHCRMEKAVERKEI